MAACRPDGQSRGDPAPSGQGKTGDGRLGVSLNVLRSTQTLLKLFWIQLGG